MSTSSEFVLDSGIAGPELLVFGGIHGDEPCGEYAIKRFLSECDSGLWNLNWGRVTFAIGNLKAIEQKKRYVDYNMNRMFGLPNVAIDSLEYDRVRLLETLFDSKDAFLDLHSASSAAPDFLMAEKSCLPLAKKLGARFVVSGWENFSDVGGDTECFANAKGALGLTYEAGQNDDPQTLENAYNMLLRFLAVYGVIEFEFEPVQSDYLELSDVVLKQSEDDCWLLGYENFQFVKKNTKLLKVGGKEFCAPYDCYLVFPCDPARCKALEELCFLAKSS